MSFTAIQTLRDVLRKPAKQESSAHFFEHVFGTVRGILFSLRREAWCCFVICDYEIQGFRNKFHCAWK